MGIKEDLELNITEALRAIGILNAALLNSAKQFKAGLADATSVLNNVKVNINQADLKKNIEDGAKGAKVTVSPTIDTKQVKGQMDLFNQTVMANGKFEQLTLPFDPQPAIKNMELVQQSIAQTSTRAQIDFQKIGSSAVQLGQTLTVALTLPIAALGTAAVTAGNSFELAFSRMVGLANVPAGEVDRLREGVLQLGGETAKSPNELAEALYYINSSGIAAADSLPVLEKAAQAAAAGLGRTKDVADVITSVMNAYGKENISAAQATDILTQAVRDGKGEPEAFAQVLGRVVPAAAKLGVEFDQVAAALAVMTRTGLSASEASISLNQVFNSFLNTTREGEKVLEAHGLSLAQIREILAQPGGLLNTLRLLDQAFGGNLEVLDQVIPNVRALRGFLNILAQDTGSVSKVFESTNVQLRNTDEALGASIEAFKAYRETTQFEVDRAKEAVTASLISIGVTLAPLVRDIAEFVQGLTVMFDSLGGGQEKTLLIIAAVAAAMGPLLIVTGSLINSIRTIIAIGPQMIAVFSNPVFLAGAVAVGLIAKSFYDSARAAAEAEARTRDFTTAIRQAGDVASGVELQIRKIFEVGDKSNDDLLRSMQSVGLELKDMSDALTAGEYRFTEFRRQVLEAKFALLADEDKKTFLDQLEDGGLTLDTFIDKVVQGENNLSIFGDSVPGKVKTINDQFTKLDDKLFETGKAVVEAKERSKLLADVLGTTANSADNAQASFEALPPSLQAIVDAAQDTSLSVETLTLVMDNLSKSVPNFAVQVSEGMAAINKNTGGAANAIDALKAANEESTKASGGATKAQDTQADSAEKAAQAQQKYEDSLYSVEKAQRAVLEAQNDLNEAIRGPSESDITDLQLRATDDMLSLEEATVKAADARKKLLALQDLNRPEPATKEELDTAALDEQKALLKVLQAQQALKKSGAALEEAQTFDPSKDKAVADAKLKLKDAETALAKQLRESKDAYEAITKAVEDVQKAEGGRSAAIKEKYIPTIEEFTAQLAKNFTNQLNFFNNIKSLVDRGATELAKSILSVAATDKESAARLAEQATTLTDEALAEQERLVTETNARNKLLVEAQTKLFEDLLRGSREKAPEVQQAIIDLFDIPDDELIAASGYSAGQLFMEGLIKGIGDNAQGTADAARDGINNAIRAAREAAGIKSPSIVMALIGRQMAEGLVLGLAQEQAKASAAAKALVQSAVSAVSGSQSALVPVGTGLASLVQPTSPLAPTSSQVTNDLDFNIQIDNVTAADAEQVGIVVGEAAARSYLASRATSALLDSGFH